MTQRQPKNHQRRRRGRIRIRLFLLFVILVVVGSGIYLLLIESSSSSVGVELGYSSSNGLDQHHQYQHHHSSSQQVIPKIVSLICRDPSVSVYHILKHRRPSSESHHRRPKVLCLVLTQHTNHHTRLAAIRDTWGRKCDTLIAASDQTDPLMNAYAIDSLPGYWGIWDKLMQTLRLVMDQTLVNQTYDWILKADDDTYVIMENLHAFLMANDDNTNNNNSTNTSTVPLVYGRTMPWPKLKELKRFPGWFRSKQNKAFGNRFYKKFNENQTLVYPHGGPGYIMNWNYAEVLTRAYFHSKNSVKGKISEDLANAVTMLYRGIHPQSTFDTVTQRERSHPESPKTMYENPQWLPLVQSNIQHLANGEACCSPTSISFHHVTAHDMRLLEYQLYTCPNLLR